MGWTFEYVEAMLMARFMEMLDDFSRFPPLYEVARTQVLLPGDKGYKAPPKVLSRQTIDAATGAKDATREPEWLRNARLKREAKRNG
jgi:hypothetical protein